MDPYQQSESPTPVTDENQQLGGQEPTVEPTYQTPDLGATQPTMAPTPEPVAAAESITTAPVVGEQPAVQPVIPMTPPSPVQTDVVSTTPTENTATASVAAPSKKSVRLWLWLSLAFVVLALAVLVVFLYVVK